MSHFDVFNGDADGICALQQLRLAQPLEAQRVTGLKRDIELLARVQAVAGDSVTVLDVSLARNREALDRLLAQGVRIEYFDHHFAGEPPRHANLQLHIDTAADTCTSLLVDRHLGGRQRPWAIVGAFGDNMREPAHVLAQAEGLDEQAEAVLRELGEAINYNAYGETPADPLVAPQQLFEMLHPYDHPLDFVAAQPIAARLVARMHEDLARAVAVQPLRADPRWAVYLLPDEPWARRVLGSHAYALARAWPQRAHAVLRLTDDDAFVVSVRAPLSSPAGADLLCRRYPTGGGRVGAAGIDRLPAARLDEFLHDFGRTFGHEAAV